MIPPYRKPYKRFHRDRVPKYNPVGLAISDKEYKTKSFVLITKGIDVNDTIRKVSSVNERLTMLLKMWHTQERNEDYIFEHFGKETL